MASTTSSVIAQPGLPPRWLRAMRSGPVYSTICVGFDVIASGFAVAAAVWWDSDDSLQWLPWLYVPVVVGMLASRGLYRKPLNRSALDELLPVHAAAGFAALVVLVVMLAFTSADRPGLVAVLMWLGAAALLSATHLFTALMLRYLRRKYRLGARTLIIGIDPIALQLAARLKQVPDYGLVPVRLLDGRPPTLEEDEFEFGELPFLNAPEDLSAIISSTGAREAIIAPSTMTDEELSRTAGIAHLHGLQVRVVPRLMDAMGVGARVEHVGGIPLIVLSYTNPRGWQFAVKHTMDRTLAALGLLLIAPLFGALALAVRFSSPGPIFYRQKRVGRDSRPFDCLKFRSMRPPRESDATFDVGTTDAPGGVEGTDRRTRIGRIMRQTSLDELPQLLNVLRGEMSLVGPRPERPEFVELFDLQVRRYGDRHRVKAGITGWSQVHGLRGQTSIADRAEYDNYYIENWSLLLDLKILALTVLAVLRRAED